MNPKNIPQWHLEESWKAERIQIWWREQWQEKVSETYRPIFSNINVGDCFSHGRSAQISIITEKIVLMRSAVGLPHTHEYTISHRIGGHWFHPTHEDIIEKGFLFIPSPEQLISLGHTEWAWNLLCSYQKWHLVQCKDYFSSGCKL